MNHCWCNVALHMVGCCCREDAKQVVTMRVLPLFIERERERERAVSLFHLCKWMWEWCFTLHLQGLHWFVTNPVYLCNPSCSWGMESDCIKLCLPVYMWQHPCRFLDQFCWLLQIFSATHSVLAGPCQCFLFCFFFQEGGSNATLSLLHCNQFSTCLMNLGQTPLLHRTCTIHSDAKEEMAGAKRKALSTMISSKYSVAFWSLVCMLSKVCSSTLQCALVLERRQVLHMNGSINVPERY